MDGRRVQLFLRRPVTALPGFHPPRLSDGWPTTPAKAGYSNDLVDPVGFEPTTSSMPLRRAPNCAMGPGVDLAGFEPATSSVRLMRAPNCATGPRRGVGIVLQRHITVKKRIDLHFRRNYNAM